MMRILFSSLLLLPCVSLSGPYPDAAGQPGSTAVAKDDSSIVGWVAGWVDYLPGANVDQTWQTPEKALGKAVGNSVDIVCLGSGGRITLTFNGVITNGAGPDFAVFENSFSDTFLELGRVEVSSDGIHFFRFATDSLTASPVGSFGSIDPTDLDGFVGKYRQGFGTPFDLDDLSDDPNLDKNAVRFVRIIDVVGDGSELDSSGDPIFDPYPSSGSAGIDLEAVAVLNGSPNPDWSWFRLPDQPAAGEVGFRNPSFAMFPDGRFMYLQGRYTSGEATRIWTQTVWGEPRLTQTSGQQDADPAFLAILDANHALVGSGGNFGELTDIWSFDPSNPEGPAWQSVEVMQHYSGSHWRNPDTGTEGWLVVGANGTGGKNAVSFVSLDGLTNKVIIDEVSDFSSGVTIAPNGDVYVAGFDFSSPPEPAYYFPAALVEGAISGSPLNPATGDFVFGFDSAGGLAVDARGRVWAGGFASDGYLQMYDPDTGGVIRVKPDHPELEGAGSLMYSPVTFSRGGVDYVGWSVRDAYDIIPDHYFGYGAIDHHEAPPITGWLHEHYGDEVYDPSKEATEWGDSADGDGDELSTLLEYALKTDPTTHNRLTDAYTVTVDGPEFEIAFDRDPLRSDIDIVVEVSATPGDGSWSEIARSVAGAPTASSGIGAGRVSEAPRGDDVRGEVADPVTVGAVPARFARVRVIRNE